MVPQLVAVAGNRAPGKHFLLCDIAIKKKSALESRLVELGNCYLQLRVQGIVVSQHDCRVLAFRPGESFRVSGTRAEGDHHAHESGQFHEHNHSLSFVTYIRIVLSAVMHLCPTMALSNALVRGSDLG